MPVLGHGLRNDGRLLPCFRKKVGQFYSCNVVDSPWSIVHGCGFSPLTMDHRLWTACSKIIKCKLTYIIIRRIVYFCRRMIEFTLTGDYIHLIQLLKAAGLVQTGGEAQIAVTEGEVMYNGHVDYRKRLKVKRGDTVEFNGTAIRII